MSDNTALDKLSKIMEVDPVLTARMLRLVNSVKTGLPTKVATVKQAVALSGLNQVRCALLGVMMRDYLPNSSKKTLETGKQLWGHSLMTAVMAQLLAQKSFPELQDTAFVGGLLHDIGKIVIQDVFPDSVTEIIALQEEARSNSLEAEQNVVGVNHCLVGKMLAEHWNLPEPLLDCIWLHHHQPEVPDMASAHRELIWIVALANILAADMLMVPRGNGRVGVQESLLTALKLRESDLEAIRLDATKEYGKKASFFNLESDLHVIFHDVLQKANQKLSRMGVELDTQRAALIRSNNLLELTRKLCLGLGGVRSKEDLFLQVTYAFQGFAPVPLGIFYIIEQETRELEGVVWTESGRRRRLLCFTNRNGEPVWEHDDQGLPSDLRKILSYYKLRAQKTEAICVTTSPPFHVFSFGLEGEYFAELCISVQQEYRDKDNTQLHAFLHLAQLLWSAVQSVRLLERLQRNQDDLSQALWKNKQINEHIFQTERLAAVGQLAAGAAHEINNPLAIISARAQLLELKEQDEKKKKELAVISQQIDRISKILSNLMDFARPVPPKLKDVDIHGVLDRVLELAGNDLAKHGIGLKKRYDPSMVRIKADPNQLEQVFLNLVINAQHAMEKSGGVLTISTTLTGAGTKAVIKVADQGVGISRENMKRIFDPFFTTKAEGKGTGLGLSTSLGIINSHFGKIDIDSTLGKGTVFTIELPVDIAALRPDKVEGESLPAPLLSSRTKVLVVDDEEHIREILKETLEGEGIVAATAGNGQEALEMLAAEVFDLMLLDIKMPFCDGLSVLREVRKADPVLPVIVITGMASREEMEEAKSYGNCKCIRKPFHIKTLLAEIRESLANMQ
jgi:putative nucleotidyltransferase with HDIG domain